ncbi:hypothetical protein BHE74_00027835 [Ensete ventricosum]|nr:hypothetical protein BHE74_00027835 [Ensete ventricosum]
MRASSSDAFDPRPMYRKQEQVTRPFRFKSRSGSGSRQGSGRETRKEGRSPPLFVRSSSPFLVLSFSLFTSRSAGDGVCVSLCGGGGEERQRAKKEARGVSRVALHHPINNLLAAGWETGADH